MENRRKIEMPCPLNQTSMEASHMVGRRRLSKNSKEAKVSKEPYLASGSASERKRNCHLRKASLQPHGGRNSGKESYGISLKK